MFSESLKIPPFESSFKMEVSSMRSGREEMNPGKKVSCCDVQEVPWKIIVDVKK